MENSKYLEQSRTLATINLIVGIWLIVAPYFINPLTSQAFWNATIIGIALVIFSGIRLAMPRATWASGVNAILGIWLIIAPFALGFLATGAYWNQIISGIIVLIVAMMNMSGQRSHTGTGHPA